jgi:hypothetical protein
MNTSKFIKKFIGSTIAIALVLAALFGSVALMIIAFKAVIGLL